MRQIIATPHRRVILQAVQLQLAILPRTVRPTRDERQGRSKTGGRAPDTRPSEGCTVLLFGGVNAFDSVKRSRLLLALAKAFPLLRDTFPIFMPKLRRLTCSSCPQTHRGLTWMYLRRVFMLQHGRGRATPRFRQNPLVKGATVRAYIDDVVMALPKERAKAMAAETGVTRWP